MEGIVTGPTVYSSYPRRLEPFADVITKAALSTQLFLRGKTYDNLIL